MIIGNIWPTLIKPTKILVAVACIDAMTAERGDPYYWPECTCQLPCRDDEYIYETSRAILTQVIQYIHGVFEKYWIVFKFYALLSSNTF